MTADRAGMGRGRGFGRGVGLDSLAERREAAQRRLSSSLRAAELVDCALRRLDEALTDQGVEYLDPSLRATVRGLLHLAYDTLATTSRSCRPPATSPSGCSTLRSVRRRRSSTSAPPSGPVRPTRTGPTWRAAARADADGNPRCGVRSGLPRPDAALVTVDGRPAFR